jgi:hypothetical protein
MSNKKLLSILVRELSAHKFRILTPDSGSIYMIFEGTKVKQVRISNHKGRKPKRNCWELRTDASTSRKGSNRIYSAGSFQQLINDFN